MQIDLNKLNVDTCYTLKTALFEIWAYYRDDFADNDDAEAAIENVLAACEKIDDRLAEMGVKMDDEGCIVQLDE